MFRCTLCGLEIASPKPLIAWAHHYKQHHAGGSR